MGRSIGRGSSRRYRWACFRTVADNPDLPLPEGAIDPRVLALGWVSLTEQKWVNSAERQRPNAVGSLLLPLTLRISQLNITAGIRP
jgi:hypothetical protein